NAPHILAVRDGLPAKNATELVAMAKRDPGKYTIASSGVGTIVQMAAELFKHETGADLLVVPFKGGQPATLALLSGEVDMIVNDPDYAARLATMAVEPMVMTPEQASAFVAGEVRKWKTVAAAAKIQVD